MCTRVFFFYFVTFTRLLQPRTSVYLDPPPESVNSREGIRPRQIFQTLSQNSLAGNVGFLVCVRLLVEIARKACGSRPKNKIADDPCESLLRIDVLTSFSNNLTDLTSRIAAPLPRSKEEKQRKRGKKREKKRNRGSRRNARVSEHWQARTRTIPHIRERKIVVLSQIKRKTKKKQKQGKREREIARE